jgi:signal transduction histidine kinase
MNRLRARFDALALWLQLGVCGTLAGGVLAVVVAWFGPLSAPLAPAACAGAGALLATAVACAVSRRTGRALSRIEASARRLRRETEINELNFERTEVSAELHRATSALRRLVDAHRQRMVALMASHAALGRRLDLRTHELSTLQGLSIGLASKSELHELVDETLGALEKSLDYSSASIWARAREPDRAQVVLVGYRDTDARHEQAEDLQGKRLGRQYMEQYERIERSSQPVVENDVRQSLFSWLWSRLIDDAQSSTLYRTTRAWMAVPMIYRQEVLAVLRVDHHEPHHFDPERVRLLAAIGSQAALAMHHSELLSRQREVAVIMERNRIARDLHDAVSQTLFAAHVLAGTLHSAAARLQAPEAAPIRSQSATLAQLTQGALAELRLLMFELRPDALEQARLVELLRNVTAALRCRGDLRVEERLAGDDPLDPATRIQVYRIAQEAVSNVARHSGATLAVVEWEVQAATRATLRVADNGKGYDVDTGRPGSFGLDNMRTRARDIGASLTLSSAAGVGSEVRLDIDLAPVTTAAH